MWIDFHVHGKLTKASDFELDYFEEEIEFAKEAGLDAFVMSEHFNTKDYYSMYDAMEQNYYYKDGHYLINDFKVFMGLEVDVKNGGHVILVSHRENILEVRKILDVHTEKDNFIPFKQLLDLAEEFNCLTIGAHPFRGEHPLALNQEFEQLKRLDAIDLNATDIFSKGLDETYSELIELSQRLGIEIVTGSDTHYPVQLGSVKTKLRKDCSTIEEIKDCIKNADINREVSNILDAKVFAARTTKKHLKSLIIA